jgi:hypothetical protein
VATHQILPEAPVATLTARLQFTYSVWRWRAMAQMHGISRETFSRLQRDESDKTP